MTLSPAYKKILMLVCIGLPVSIAIIYALPFFYSVNSGVQDPSLDYAIGLIAAIILSLIVVALPFKNKDILLAAWFFGLIIIFIASYFYEIKPNADEHVYFIDSLTTPLYHFILLQGTININTIISYFNLLYPSFRLNLVIFSFIGFIAQYLFWYAFSKMTGVFHRTFLAVMMFFPSLLF